MYLICGCRFPGVVGRHTLELQGQGAILTLELVEKIGGSGVSEGYQSSSVGLGGVYLISHGYYIRSNKGPLQACQDLP